MKDIYTRTNPETGKTEYGIACTDGMKYFPTVTEAIIAKQTIANTGYRCLNI